MTKKACITKILSFFILLFHINIAAATEIDPFKYFNVYSLGNIGTSSDVFNTDIQGTTGAAGNTYFGSFGATNTIHNTYVLHTGGNANLYHGSYNGSIDIGGSADMHNITIAGSAYSGGDMVFHDGSATGVLNTAGTMTCYKAYCGRAKGGVTYDPVFDFSGLNQYFLDASSDIASMGTTGVAVSSWGNLIINAGSGINVFNVDAYLIDSSSSIKISGPSDAVVYINVSNSDAGLTGATPFSYSGGISAHNVIVNYPEATRLDITSGMTINILAPLADTYFTSGVVNGILIAGNLYGGAQVNNGYFNYTPPVETNPVPEPATIILLGGGMAGLLVFRKKAKN